jgi:hypothetical protein
MLSSGNAWIGDDEATLVFRMKIGSVPDVVQRVFGFRSLY